MLVTGFYGAKPLNPLINQNTSKHCQGYFGQHVAQWLKDQV